MQRSVRELWNPWATAFLSADVAASAADLPLDRPPVAGASHSLIASVWERDADGSVQQIALGSAEPHTIPPR
jgi:hypothetical protein